MSAASFVADRRTRIRKKFQLPNGSDYMDNYKENSSDNAQLFSEDSLFSKRDISSNIVLRLSDSGNYNIEESDTSQNNNIANYRYDDNSLGSKSFEKSEVIIISDSSDNDEFPSREPQTSQFATNSTKSMHASVYISSTTDESDEKEDFILKNIESKKVTHNKGRGRFLSNFKHNHSSFKTKQRCSILYTSDDTASTASSSKSKSKSSPSRRSKNTTASLGSHVSPTPRSVGSNNSIKSHKSVSKYVSKQVERIRDNPTSSGIGMSPSFCSTKYQKVFPRRISNRGTQLTKLDALKILKAVKSKRVKYFSPSSSEKSRVSETPDSDEEIQKDKPKKSNIIEETDSEVDEEIGKSIIKNTPEISKPLRSQVSKFLETPTNNQEPGYNDLSARKRKEIANWLLANSPDSKNDSSLSHVSESNRNSLSSGNSSLERLEANFETPNNRDKFKRRNIDDRGVNTDPKTPTNVFPPDVLNGITLKATDKRVNTRTPQETPDHSKTAISTVKKRQTKIDDYLRKTKTPSGQYINELTPTNKTIRKPPSVSKQLNPEDVKIEDCVDILDKLYGDTWRAKADMILSEPRIKPVAKKDRAVQTERKVKPGLKGRLNLESDSEEDFEFGKFSKSIKATLNPTKKNRTQGPQTTSSTRKTKRQESHPKHSFINDDSSSEGSGRSSYYTAHTNPLLNNNIKPAPAPVSASTQRVMAICDPESDQEVGNAVNNLDFPNDKRNRRKLSFSDSDIDSGTSEFDPEDIVPPKSPSKKNVPKSAHRFSKPSIKSIRKVEVKKAPSFIASLSTSVPMSCSHPEARVYKGSFKKTKEALCKKLYSLFNEKVFDKKLPDDMSIEWSTRMTGTAGFCYNKKSIRALGSVTRSSRIVLATKVCDNPERVRDTLVHEMCHAATWIINEISEGHGPLWKGWATKAMQAFPELPHISRCHDYQIRTKYTYKCTTCGYSIGRHSKSLDIQKKRCGYCYGKFEVFVNRTTKSGNVQKTPSRKKDPSAFALFVKENYSSVKQNRRSMKHGEVMKVLGQQFSAIKIAKKQDDIIEENEDNISD